MNHAQEPRVVPSYFWSCVTLTDECPFFSTVDPYLYYYGIGVTVLYAAFLLMIFADLKYYWSIDHFQRQIEYYINLVRKKVRHVQLDQRRLMSTQERTEKQLKRSEECKTVVTSIRGALCMDNPREMETLTLYHTETQSSARNAWTASRRSPQSEANEWLL
ncbi:unnamed protein product [Chrysodeixis includens]|uniref:Uncharacterized protein n=1 Tax=Chrysodeixis includens TaxID=689277 RepID=A0A9N8PZG0_CHRIL|nr:unnamed protein product [Chrysodeixis includens]